METCTDCGDRATCEYDWGTGLRRGCAAHDPLRWPYSATMARLPSYYRTIWAFPVLATTGHLGIGGGWQHQNIAATPPSAMTCTAGTGLT